MTKFTKFLIIACVLLLLFNLGGIINEDDISASGYLFKTLDISHPENFDKSDVFTLILGLGAVIGTGAIIVSFFTKTSIQDSIITTIKVAAVPTLMLGVLLDFTIIFIKLAEFSRPIAILFFSPFLIGYIMAGLDWVQGLG